MCAAGFRNATVGGLDVLWVGGIAAGLFGGSYGLPVALALFVVGFFVFVSAPASRWSSSCGKPDTVTVPTTPTLRTMTGNAPPCAAY